MATLHGEDSAIVGDGPRRKAAIAPIDRGAVMIGDRAARVESIRLRAARIGEGCHRESGCRRVDGCRDVDRRGNNIHVGDIHVERQRTRIVGVVGNRLGNGVGSLLAVNVCLGRYGALAGDAELGVRRAVAPINVRLPQGRTGKRVDERT